MFKTISNFMRVGDIRNKILFTLLMLVVFRIGTFIPVPNVNADVLKAQDELNVFGILNTFGGGALFNFSILAMGIMPYITASIIIQLLQMDVVPKFTEWSKQGDVGRRKLAQFTRYFTIILGFIQALGMSYRVQCTVRWNAYQESWRWDLLNNCDCINCWNSIFNVVRRTNHF